MLTVEEIKNCIEEFKPEGFVYHERSCSSFTLEYKNSCFEIEYDTLKYSANTEVYELFLQRVIEGINRSNPEWIQISQCGYCVQVLTDCNRDVLLSIDLTINNIDIDEAKEQAIKYILENI